MVSIIIPVYNQKHEMLEAVRRISDKIKNVQIIIAEDGSSDGSYKLAKKLAKNDNVILSHKKNRTGKGEAIKRAISLCTHDTMGFVDADLSVDIPYIKDLIEETENNDIVIASRHLDASKVKRSFRRFIFSHMYNFLVRMLFHSHIKDHQCGFKFFSVKGKEIVSNVKSNGFLFDTELLALAQQKGLNISEVPVKWEEKGNSQLGVKSKIKMFFGLFLLKPKMKNHN